MTAAAFVATIDDVQRFHHAHQLEAYLGDRAQALDARIVS